MTVWTVQDKRERAFSITKKKRRPSKELVNEPSGAQKGPPKSSTAGMPALREVRLFKETDDTKIGAVFHRSDDAFDKSFFNVEGSSVQPIIKKAFHDGS